LHQDTHVGAGEHLRVLVVEDDARAAALIAALLRTGTADGLVLAHAAGLPDASRELLERGADCVLLPAAGDAGETLSALDQLVTAVPDVAVVLLLATGDQALAPAAIRRGAQDCLVISELSSALLMRAVVHAVTRKRSEVRLVHQALHDPLTGLPNRALFLDRLGVALDRAKRTKTPIAVLFLDVDNFKEINDTMGHAAGDELLARLSDRLRAMLRPMDTVARFGGDEFTFLFEDLTSEREVVLITERVSRAVVAPLRLGDSDVTVTASIGITVISDASVPPETVIRDADAAMYRAKELGGARYELYDEATRQRATQRLELEADLRGAIDRSELRVHYQPSLSLNGRTSLVGFEALVRWEHPERGLIAPDQFLPLAEETGMMGPIGAFVLEQSLRQLATWRESSPELTLSINLTRPQLVDAGLTAMLSAAMQTVHVAPEALTFEVTEQAVAHDPEVAVRALEALKLLGVRLAIDDYGTGSSLLSSLGQLPVDALKIHESFVRGLGGDSREATIVGAVIGLGHALGLTVVAEGVETDAQLAELRALGCDGAQGYLFGAAVPEDQAGALIHR
jgi:diguanylate cyclase (GGDEF)-like protein